MFGIVAIIQVLTLYHTDAVELCMAVRVASSAHSSPPSLRLEQRILMLPLHVQSDPGGLKRSIKRGSWFNPETLANQKVVQLVLPGLWRCVSATQQWLFNRR